MRRAPPNRVVGEQLWAGAVLDNSSDTATTTAFQLGVHVVVPGWDVALVGSRVMLTPPPGRGVAAAR